MNLKSRFFEAFSERPRPRDAQILRPEVGTNGEQLRSLLASKTSTELAQSELRSTVEGNLWMLSPEAFGYFLPAFMNASLESYEALGVFVSELVAALTKPTRADVVESLDEFARAPLDLGLPEDTLELLRSQQLEWFDSGVPLAIFQERVEALTTAEGEAVLAFLLALEEAHGEDFPLGELDIAVQRYWDRYRDP